MRVNIDYTRSCPLSLRTWPHGLPSIQRHSQKLGSGLGELTELQPGVPAWVQQYPMSWEVTKGITPHIRRLMELEILSAWNTPLLPIKNQPMQDLREASHRVMDVHLSVPNPYTLPPTWAWCMVLDFKDAFFSLPSAPKSQSLFVLEWHDPGKRDSGLGPGFHTHTHSMWMTS